MNDRPSDTTARPGCRARAWITALLIGVPAMAGAASGGTARPHEGRCETVVNTLPSGTLEIALDCHFRHLGRTTGLLVQQVIPTGPPVDGVLPAALSATVSYTAANGDTLVGTFTGTAAIDLVTGAVRYSGVETLTGGTGRFADASGVSLLTGTASTVSNTGFYVTSGTLDY
jgi:hypothetical protein